MKLSVVIPVYNGEKYLSKCIESVMNQSKKELEIILIDDGSTDTSGDICDHYRLLDNRIKVVHQKNTGIIHARKTGVDSSTAQYITFVDSDDMVEETSFVLADKFMEKQIDIVCFGFTNYKNGSYYKKQDDLQCGYYDSERIEKEIIPDMIWNDKKASNGLTPSLCTKVIRRELLVQCYDNLDKYYFDFCEDRAIIYPLILMATSMQICPETYYICRKRPKAQIPYYISKESFFDDLFEYYTFMKKNVAKSDELTRQLELAYIDLVSSRRMVYGLAKNRGTCLFPFDRVDKGERVVIFGAGIVGKAYVEQIEKLAYCVIAIWIDSNYSSYSDERVMPVENILNCEYDKIVIAVSDNDVKGSMMNQLLNMGVPKEVIVS